MCRHLAYLGPDVRVTDVICAPPHSLEHQAWAAKELLSGVVAADGFGVAWYDERAGETPAVYRTTKPIWTDRVFRSVGGHAFARAVVANVRNATEVGTTEEANVHPFDDGAFTFSHNGFLDDFRSRLMRDLRKGLSERHYASLRGTSDAETVFRLVLTRIDAGETPRDALLAVTRHLLTRAEGIRIQAQLNFLLTDGRVVYATRASNRDDSNSLYTIHHGKRFPEASIVASEPLDDDPAWTAVPHNSLVVMHAGEPVDVHRL